MAAVILLLTHAVVAIFVELSNTPGVGAVGVPLNDGLEKKLKFI